MPIASADKAKTAEFKSQSVEELARELSNPATPLASLNNVFEIFTFKGDQLGADSQTRFSYSFQPSMPEGSKHKAVEKTEPGALTPCPEPRPQICTREFRPVCAQMQDGSFKTYSTGCTSCTDPKVVGYRDGACK